MTSSTDNPSGRGLPPEWEGEVSDLLTRLSDGLLDEGSLQRLGDLLASDSEVRLHYLRHVGLRTALGTVAGYYASERREALAPLTILDDMVLAGAAAEPSRGALAASRSMPRRRWLAAAAILLLAGVGAWMARPEAKTSTGGPRDPSEIAVISGDADAKPLVAEITYASAAVQWRHSNESYALTSRVRDGHTLALALGTIELTYPSRTTLRLTGPSEFVVDANGGTLVRGEIVAHVTEQGHGFTINTPNGKVIDRGTAFGVVVDDFGVSEVSVFEGRVEAFPVGGSGPLAEKIDLTTGRMLQWSGDSILTMNAAQRAMPPVQTMAATDLIATTPTLMLDGRFGAKLDRRSWTPLGEVRMARRGLLLDGRASSTERPYVITAHEYDPSQGPLLISCNVRFENAEADRRPAFSILTRSANQRSKPSTPWQDMLASCVRCSLKADAISGEGMLEAGTKYEFDRELSNISWSGFVRPQSDVTYRLEMRDDGLNVSFTASLVDNPSVRKTVTCRSLFRGVRNFVALEGFSGGAATVSDVRISQELSQQEMGAVAADDDSPVVNVSSNQPPIDQLFDEFIPRDAQLRIASDFRELDEAQWLTLGDVFINDGRLQLGVANSEQHIDTWRKRPYLLTREQFDPSKRPLTIVCQASFAPNFLRGYGGSFAVLTRADAQYGAGAGWEKSALGRGVRANFWPAAFGQNHSLELFEMLSPLPVNLLATAELPIDATSRTYVYCISDDGANVALTVVDPRNPHVRKTLAHATKTSLLGGGHIAFEGCWGAPVQLDSVRIYERAASSSADD